MSGTVDPKELHKELRDRMFAYSQNLSQNLPQTENASQEKPSTISELSVLNKDELLEVVKLLKEIVKEYIATDNYSLGDIENPVLNDEIVKLIIEDMESLSSNKPTRIDYDKLVREQFSEKPLFLLNIMQKIYSPPTPPLTKNTNNYGSTFSNPTVSSMSKKRPKKGGRQLTKKRNARKNKQTKFIRKSRSINGTNLSMKHLQLGLVSSHKRRTKNIKNSLSGGEIDDTGFFFILVVISPIMIPISIPTVLLLYVLSSILSTRFLGIMLNYTSIELIKEFRYTCNKNTYIKYYGTKKFLEYRFELTYIINTIDLLIEIDRKSLTIVFYKFAEAISHYSSKNREILASDLLQQVAVNIKDSISIINPKEFTTKYNNTFEDINKKNLYSYFTNNPKDSFIEYIQNKQRMATSWLTIPKTCKNRLDRNNACISYIKNLANDKQKEPTYEQLFIKTLCNAHFGEDAQINTTIITLLEFLKNRVIYIAGECTNGNIFTNIKRRLFKQTNNYTKDDIRDDIINEFDTGVVSTKDGIITRIDEYIRERGDIITETCGWKSLVESNNSA